MNTLNAIYRPVREEIEKVKGIVKDSVAAMEEIRPRVEPYFNGEAKYMRPFLALMSAKMAPDGGLDAAAADKLCRFAAAVELIHTASLVHDDIIDCEPKRRGQLSLNIRYGPQNAVLLGDMLYTKALQLLAKSFSPAVMGSLLETVNKMCLGQLMEKTENNPGKRGYLNMIRLKTGLLMGFSCTGIACADEKLISGQRAGALFNFGVYAGMFYQMVDDAVDGDAGAVITDGEIESVKRLAAGELAVFPPSAYKTGILDFLDYISRYKNERALV